jgi:hypothetical protein
MRVAEILDWKGLKQKSLCVNVDTFTRVLSLQKSWMNGQTRNPANLSTIPAGTRIPDVQQLKQARTILCVAANYFKIWSACGRHEFEYNA